MTPCIRVHACLHISAFGVGVIPLLAHTDLPRTDCLPVSLSLYCVFVCVCVSQIFWLPALSDSGYNPPTTTTALGRSRTITGKVWAPLHKHWRMTRENSNTLHNIMLLMSAIIITVRGDWSGDVVCVAVRTVYMVAYVSPQHIHTQHLCCLCCFFVLLIWC